MLIVEIDLQSTINVDPFAKIAAISSCSEMAASVSAKLYPYLLLPFCRLVITEHERIVFAAKSNFC
jgi:hypothetical protein